MSEELEPERERGAACVIGPGARFDGLLSFWGAARVEGELRGEVQAHGTFEVGSQARVAAHIEADVIVIEGSVEGEVVARERVEVLPGAHVRATIRTPRLAVAEGARFEGRLAMAQQGASTPTGGRSGASLRAAGLPPAP